MTLRPANRDDANALTDIALLAKRRWGYPDAWMAAWRPDLTVTPEYLARHAVFVAEAGGAAVGFCALEEEPSAWTLAHLWVHPEHHGRGIGSALFERAARYAAGRRPDAPIRIVADPHAEAFYRRSGARRIGREQAPVDGHPRELPVLLFEAT